MTETSVGALGHDSGSPLRQILNMQASLVEPTLSSALSSFGCDPCPTRGPDEVI